MTSTNDIPQSPAVLDYGTSRSVPPRGRILQLDILRGVAILLVLFRHNVAPFARSRLVQPFMDVLRQMGWVGVDLFFVLSGFLIGGLLFKEILATSRLDVKRFLIRRGFKIWPSYFLLVAVLIVEQIWQYGMSRGLHAMVPNLIHLQNYLGSPRGFTWSLAVEEHFYLALPVFLLLVIRRGKGLGNVAVPVAVLAVAITCLALRLSTAPSHREPESNEWMLAHMWPTHLRIDSLFFGVFLAYLYHMRPGVMDRIGQYRLPLLLVGLALVAPSAKYDNTLFFMNTLGFTSMYMGFGCILIALLYTPPGVGLAGRLVNSPPMRALAVVGTYSYTMYLWQTDLARIPVEHFLLPWCLKHIHNAMFGIVVTGAQIGLTFVAGVIMARLIERPALALRERLFPGRVSSPATHALTDVKSPEAFPVPAASL